MRRSRRRRRNEIFKLKNAVKFIFILGFCSFVIIQILSQFRLTKIFASQGTISSPKRDSSKLDLSGDAKIGEFCETVIAMLPDDMAFTLFLPSEKSFEHYLGLNGSRGLMIGESANDTFAILTRVLGFSAVPRWILAADLEVGKEVIYDSISGFNLYISKDSNRSLVVNGVASEMVDLKIGKNGKTLVHVMDGVMMDSEFEESMLPENV